MGHGASLMQILLSRQRKLLKWQTTTLKLTTRHREHRTRGPYGNDRWIFAYYAQAP